MILRLPVAQAVLQVRVHFETIRRTYAHLRI